MGGKYIQPSFYTRGDNTAQGAYSMYDRVNAAYLTSPTTINTGVTGTVYTQIIGTPIFIPSNCNDFDIVFIFKDGDVGTVYFDIASIKQITNAALVNGVLY